MGRALGSYHIPLSSLCQVNPSTNVLVLIYKEIPSREKFHPPSHGIFFSATLQLLAWKRSQKTPHISLTGWQISHTCETHLFTFPHGVAAFQDLSASFISGQSLCLFFSWLSLTFLSKVFPKIYLICCLFCRAGLSDTLQVKWKNKKSKILSNC